MNYLEFAEESLDIQLSSLKESLDVEFSSEERERILKIIQVVVSGVQGYIELIVIINSLSDVGEAHEKWISSLTDEEIISIAKGNLEEEA